MKSIANGIRYEPSFRGPWWWMPGETSRAVSVSVANQVQIGEVERFPRGQVWGLNDALEIQEHKPSAGGPNDYLELAVRPEEGARILQEHPTLGDGRLTTSIMNLKFA